MTERERLIELIRNYNSYFQNEKLADYLLDNGVVVLPLKKGITTDNTDFNTDVYCPYCGNNLSTYEMQGGCTI